MKKLLIILGVIAAAIILVLATGPFFIVNEGELALVIRFGEIVSKYDSAGLKLKTPFIDGVVKYPKKVMSWDGEAQLLQTKENQFIFVDTTARWRIDDLQKFYESIGSLDSAYGRLSDVIDSAVRRVIAKNELREAVRDSNSISKTASGETFQTGDAAVSAALATLTQSTITYDSVAKGRSLLFAEMLAEVQLIVPQFGIKVIDIIPRRITYSEDLTESVHNRMIKERNQIAQAYRSYGEGQKAELLGKMENDKRRILSEAYATAEIAKGKADADATKIYSQAYGRDPAFYDFWRAIESYRKTLPKFSKTLSTDMDYFRYLYSAQGR